MRVKLPHIKEWNEARRKHAYYYNELFKDCADIQTPVELNDTYCVYHQYTVKIPNRDEVHKMLQERGIGAMLYYPIPLHLQKVHEYLGVGKGSLPVSEKNTEMVVSLPMFPELTEEEQRTVASTSEKRVHPYISGSIVECNVKTSRVKFGSCMLSCQTQKLRLIL